MVVALQPLSRVKKPLAMGFSGSSSTLQEVQLFSGGIGEKASLPRGSITDLDILVLVVLVEFGVVRRREVFEGRSHC